MTTYDFKIGLFIILRESRIYLSMRKNEMINEIIFISINFTRSVIINENEKHIK